MNEPLILWKNQFFFLVYKPALWLSVPSCQGKNDSRPCVGIWLQNLEKQKLYPIHRLDYEVSGLLLFAQTSQAQQAASQWFEQGYVQKTYVAATEIESLAYQGRLGWDALCIRDIKEFPVFFTWETSIAMGKKRAFVEHTYGKPSLTRASLIGITQNNHALWKLEPHTGRRHQLRLELARHGCPILGDKLYGATQPNPYGPPLSLALVHIALKFTTNSIKQWGIPEEGFQLPQALCQIPTT